MDGLFATIDVFGARREVSLMLMPEQPSLGDYVLVHAGFAIQKIDREIVESGQSMHETSLALGILDVVVEKCREAGGSTVDAVRLRIGKAAGVMPEALAFGFEAAKVGTIAENAKLEIESIPVSGVCLACAKEISTDEQYVFACPHCGANTIEITQGREMEIVDMEIN